MGNTPQKKYDDKLDLPKDKHDDGFSFENLAIEGGGMRIVSAVGTISALDRHGVIKHLKRYAGTSAGGLLCLMLALGYTADEIEKIIIKTNFSKFMDDTFGVIRDTVRFINEYGIYRGDYLKDWVADLVEKKLGSKTSTFEDLYKKTGKELYIYTVCVEDNECCILSHKSSPKMELALATRMSMAVPYKFTAVKYEGKKYVDGGISHNYPLQQFDDDKNNYKTLGLKMMGSDEKRDNSIYHGKLKTDNIAAYSYALVEHMLDTIERLRVTKGYWERTITVPTFDTDMLDFGMTTFEKCNLIKKGFYSCKHQIEYFKIHKNFSNTDLCNLHKH
jgi:NTE family protein